MSHESWNLFSAAASAVATVSAAVTAFLTFRLSKASAKRAEEDAFDTDLERLALAAATARAEASNLLSLADNVRVLATSKAVARGTRGGSRLRSFLGEVESARGKAVGAFDACTELDKLVADRCYEDRKVARLRRLEASTLTTNLRSLREVLATKAPGWTSMDS